jgi:insertion element IS1 protein InsB
MALRLSDKYNIEYLCTDAYEVYSKYIISKIHTTTKAETALVESFNSLIMHYLPRFNRKTKRYSKTLDMIENSLVIFSLIKNTSQLLFSNAVN